MIKNLLNKLFTSKKADEDTYKSYYTMHFYAPANSSLSIKGNHTEWKWYATIPNWMVKRGIKFVKTSVKLDRREFDCETSILGHVITIHDKEFQQHLVNKCRKVKFRKGYLASLGLNK